MTSEAEDLFPAPDPAIEEEEEAIALSEDQQNAYDAFVRYIVDPKQTVWVLRGYAGTGKSTLVKKMLKDLPNILRTIQLIHPDAEDEWEVQLTATTNKAVEALASITKAPVRTIHSFLGLRVHKDYDTGKTSLRLRGDAQQPVRTIIFIDEASFIDRDLLRWIFQQVKDCKIVFIGDPAQILGIQSRTAPVFTAGFPESRLTKVMRQADGNPIIALASAFRHAVETGEFPSFTPDGEFIRHLPREQFEQEIVDEFSRPDWRHNDSKVLAWRNKTVQFYNHGIRKFAEGVPELEAGDYAVCNQFLSGKNFSIKTDQMVRIVNIHPDQSYGFDGYVVTLDIELKDKKQPQVFLPKELDSHKAAIKQARLEEDGKMLRFIEKSWIDLRAAYACTTNKSQGSTYDKAYIDLDDIKRCNSGNQIARMMYVGTSRARYQLVLTGDLV